MSGNNGPDYSAVEYWDQRYTRDPRPFDWLVPPFCLDSELVQALHTFPNGQVLHIGSGTSMLSFSLRNLAKHPQNIYNLDYSEQAIQWGKNMEERYAADSQQAVPERLNSRMHWIRASLTSVQDMQQIKPPKGFSVIVDKSSADSIACADTLLAQIPSPFTVSSLQQSLTTVIPDALAENDFYIDPIHVLCLHMAFVTHPGAVWICLSYSADRFQCLYADLGQDDQHSVPSELLDLGYPDIRTLWQEENCVAVETAQQYNDNGNVVHRPTVSHFLYRLRRTEVEVSLKDDLLPFSKST